jgi:hypothetical protein
MHSTKNNIVIWTEKPVYWGLESGRLERSSLLRTMSVPHQTRFNCDSKTRLPIAIHSLSTATLEKSVGFAMPILCHSTAVATPFGGVVGINNVESNIFIKASAFEISSELVERDTQDFPIEVLTFTAESFEVFNTNVSIISQSQVGDVSDDFSNTILDKVLFSGLEQSEFSDCFTTSFILRLKIFLRLTQMSFP